MNLIDRFYEINDRARTAAEMAYEFNRQGDMECAEDELRISLLYRNRMRLLVWNSAKLQKLVAELSDGGTVEYDTKLLGV